MSRERDRELIRGAVLRASGLEIEDATCDEMVETIERQRNLGSERRCAEFLWRLLDDIDTQNDVSKHDNEHFREAVNKLVKRRLEVAESPDGQTLDWKRLVQR